MDNQFEIYPDKIKNYTTSCVFILFALSLLSVNTFKTAFLFKMLATFFALLFAGFAIKIIRTMHIQVPDYVINNQGVIDNTKHPALIVPWNDILKIEITPNNTVWQIGIIAKSVAHNRQQQAEALQTNLVTNGNLAFYSVIIDGFRYRSQTFLRIFQELKKQGLQHNPQILITELTHSKF